MRASPLALPVLVGFLLLSLPAVAQKAPAGERVLSERQRTAIAMKEVRARARLTVKPGYTLKLQPTVVPFNGDPRHPITGSGPITILGYQVPKKNAVGPNGKPLKPGKVTAANTYLVNVCGNGTACLLEAKSNSRLARLGSGLAPVKEVLHDIVSSKQALSGLAQVALSGGLASASDSQNLKALAVGGVITGTQFVYNAVKGHRTVRQKALAETITWAKEEGAKPSGYPHLKTVYRHYVERLNETSPGTRPATLTQFAEQLAAQGL